ncbi:unnamed protein product [Fraxinus pennsylvanica]|uniref:Pentatricopeptide repeat-containing protein n=1 Tax=Fraxinus pennsylvanica TaxID=56036 RepID=A0AAD2DMB0_9LAMI|nr:unnamed protein product [Fraxinus pennsylvanica]
MALSLSTFPAKTLTTKTVITHFPQNPKTLILEQCKTTRDLNQVHAHLIKTRLVHHPSVVEPLLESATLLVSDATIEYAESIFCALENPDSSAYNVMIRGYTKKELPEKAILLFRQMIEQMVEPDEFTFPSILKACSRLRASREGEQIHTHVLKLQNGFGSKEFVENALVFMYASYGRVNLARQMFDEMSKRSAITWNAMFSGYVRAGYWQEVIGLFRKMIEMDVGFNEVTLISVLTACGRVRDLDLGEWIYEYVESNAFKKCVVMDGANSRSS